MRLISLYLVNQLQALFAYLHTFHQFSQGSTDKIALLSHIRGNGLDLLVLALSFVLASYVPERRCCNHLVEEDALPLLQRFVKLVGILITSADGAIFFCYGTSKFRTASMLGN